MNTALVMPWWVSWSEPTGCESEWIAPRPFWNAVAPIAAAAIMFARASMSPPFFTARGEIVLDQPHAFDRDAVGERMVARRAIGFETMRKRIHACAAVILGGMPTVSSGSQIAIFGSMAGWKMIFLVWVASSVMTPARPTSEPVPGSGGHRDDRRDAVGIRARPPVADVLEVPDRPGLPGHERDQLADIERRAAAERDDAVMAVPALSRDPARCWPRPGWPAWTLSKISIREARRSDMRGAAFALSTASAERPGSVTKQRTLDAGRLAGIGEFADPGPDRSGPRSGSSNSRIDACFASAAKIAGFADLDGTAAQRVMKKAASPTAKANGTKPQRPRPSIAMATNTQPNAIADLISASALLA